MLDNSYDAKGMKFGVLISDKFVNYKSMLYDCDSKNGIRNLANCLNIVWSFLVQGEPIIPFDDLDGLTIDDVYSLLKTGIPEDKFVFVVYYETRYLKSTDVETVARVPIFATFIYKRKDNVSIPVDVEVENEIVKFLRDKKNPCTDEEKKAFYCFLQRYRYGTKDDTDKALKEKYKIKSKK